MVLDGKKKELEVGDLVAIEFKVVAFKEDGDMVHVTAIDPMGIGGWAPDFTCDPRYTKKIAAARE